MLALLAFVLVALTECGLRQASAQSPVLPARQNLTQAGVVPEARQCLVVCPPQFRTALAPWIDHRNREGVRIQLVDSAPSAGLVKTQLLQNGLTEQTAAILLIGDCRIVAAETASADVEVPTYYRLPGPTAKFGTTPTLAGDAPYGDLNGDGVPEVAVGRLPVHSTDELAGLVQRILAYESSGDFGPWRDTVQITAGVGGFGMLADAAIESATRSVLTSTVPASTRLMVTYCSPSSDFNPGPNDFFPAVLRRYSEGGMFWVYLGHGQVTELDRVPGPGGTRRSVLNRQDVALLERPASAAPIALILACYTGAFDATSESLAERMLLSDGGPVAVLAGSRVTMPYGNAIAAQGLIHAVYQNRSANLGTAWLAAQRELAADSKDDNDLAARRQMVDILATAISPAADQLPEERLEHVHLYNLLGDPLLKLAHPGEITLQMPRGVAPGQTLLIKGVTPHAGDLSLSLCYLPGGVPLQRGLSASERYEMANDGEVARLEMAGRNAGPFAASIVLPEHVRGPMRVVARVQDGAQWSVGAGRVLVRPE